MTEKIFSVSHLPFVPLGCQSACYKYQSIPTFHLAVNIKDISEPLIREKLLPFMNNSKFCDIHKMDQLMGSLVLVTLVFERTLATSKM